MVPCVHNQTHTVPQTDRQTDGWTGRQADRQTDRQIDRQKTLSEMGVYRLNSRLVYMSPSKGFISTHPLGTGGLGGKTDLVMNPQCTNS